MGDLSAPGRNDQCHCGSGRKYKKCCLRGDQERRAREAAERVAAARADASPLAALDRLDAAVPRDLGALLAEAQALLEDEDDRAVWECLERFGRLVRAGGPAAGARFDDQEFGTVVGRRVGEVLPAYQERQENLFGRDRDDVPPSLRLLASCAPELVSEAWIERARDAMLVAAMRPLPRADRRALAVCLMIATVTRAGRDAAESPLVEVIFRVQLREWAERRDRLFAVAGSVAEDLRTGRVGHAELLARFRRHEAELGATLRADPALAEETERMLDEAAAAVGKDVRGPRPPAVLTGDEQVWLMCSLRDLIAEMEARRQRLGADPASPEERRAFAGRLTAALGQALDSEMVDAVGARLLRRAVDPAVGSKERKRAARWAMVWHDDAVLLTARLLFNPGFRAAPRAIGEQDHLARLARAPEWSAAALEPYQQFLAASGLPDAAARVRRARALLAGGPLRFGPDPSG